MQSSRSETGFNWKEWKKIRNRFSVIEYQSSELIFGVFSWKEIGIIQVTSDHEIIFTLCSYYQPAEIKDNMWRGSSFNCRSLSEFVGEHIDLNPLKGVRRGSVIENSVWIAGNRIIYSILLSHTSFDLNDWL